MVEVRISEDTKLYYHDFTIIVFFVLNPIPPEGGPFVPGLILGFLNWSKDLLVPKTFSQMNILIFTFP